MHIFGPYGADLRMAVLEEKKFEQVGQGERLPGARFVKLLETQEGKKLDTQRLKNWTGGDTMTIRPFCKPELTFRPTHKLWMAFNDKPRIEDPSVAMWSRVKLIPFEECFLGREEKDLLEKLKAEAPGILNWMIEGSQMWRAEGLEMPAKVREATEQYQEESNIALEFVKARCLRDPEAKVTHIIIKWSCEAHRLSFGGKAHWVTKVEGQDDGANQNPSIEEIFQENVEGRVTCVDRRCPDPAKRGQWCDDCKRTHSTPALSR